MSRKFKQLGIMFSNQDYIILPKYADIGLQFGSLTSKAERKLVNGVLTVTSDCYTTSWASFRVRINDLHDIFIGPNSMNAYHRFLNQADITCFDLIYSDGTIERIRAPWHSLTNSSKVQNEYQSAYLETIVPFDTEIAPWLSVRQIADVNRDLNIGDQYLNIVIGNLTEYERSNCLLACSYKIVRYNYY